jgi:hypothetical protein
MTRDQVRSEFGSGNLPNPAECEALYETLGPVPEAVRNHSRIVARVAVRLARLLAEAGCILDHGLIEAAARLHDVAKGRPDHAMEGSRLLAEKGYPRVALVVSVHTDLPDPVPDELTEAQVVYLADKMVAGVRVTSLEQRRRAARDRFPPSGEIRDRLETRWRHTFIIRDRVEAWLGQALDRLFPTGSDSPADTQP